MMRALTPMVEGCYCEVEINGTRYHRMVRWNKTDGLYIVIGNCKLFEYEFDYEIRRDEGDK